jgi:N4-gp56 family major capsid protein
MPIQGGTLTQRSTVSNLVVTAYDKLVEFNLRSEPMFRKFASKRPSDITNPGNTVVFQLHNDLDRVTTNLNEATDVDAVAIKNTGKVQVTVNEWGNVVQRTERAALETLSQIDPAIADMLSFNIADSLDYQVYSILTSKATGRSGTGTADETVVNGVDKTASGTSTLQAADVRRAVAKLRGAKVQPQDGAFYVGMLHPDVSYDLRTEAVGSGSNVWQQPHTYTEAGVGSMWTGEIGVYEGVKFIESPRVEKINGDARTITNKALTSNVATLTTSTNHGFDVGDVVTVDCDDNVFDGTFTVTVVGSATTFSYAKTNANVTSAAATGTVSAAEHKVILLGKQALLEVVTYEPKTVIGPRIDALDRFRTVGWKALLGWNIYRPEARYVITVDSSI